MSDMKPIALWNSKAAAWESGSTALVDGLQLLSRLKAHGFSGRNVHLRACARVAPDTGFARAHVKHAKSAQFNAFAAGQGLLHAFKNGFHGQLGLGFGDAGFVYHFVNDIELNHRSALLNFPERA